MQPFAGLDTLRAFPQERENPSKDTVQPHAHCVGYRAASLGQTSPSCAAELPSQNKQQNKKTKKKTTQSQPPQQNTPTAEELSGVLCSSAVSTSCGEKSAGECFLLQALRYGTVLLSAAFVAQWGLLQHVPAPLQPHISAILCLRCNPS